MAGSVKRSALMGTVMVCVLGLVQCASPAPRGVLQSPNVIPQRMTAQPALPKTAPRASPVKPPSSGSASGCSALLDRYKHEASHIPYPANLPIRPLLDVGDQLVRRYDRLPDRDCECRALVRMTLERFFVRSLGPGVAPAPKLPVAQVD